MVSERSGDGKMMIGVEKNMEIEEGEASYYQNGDQITIDPDVTMSYIDEKIQDILGQFQKDFEGGVSAENLGAKFGGYGSFLPTCARSPARSQQRTALEIIDGNTPKSSRCLDTEASQLSSLASSCSSIPLRHEFGSTANPKGNGSENGRVKGDGRVPFESVETPILSGKQKSEFPCDQRTLKVRLRFGSNNLPAGKNDEIYSGLGLDGSPSPSLNDSYTDSEWLSHDLRDVSGNSPTSILKVMTSSLLHGTQLLSPLSEELICFTENKYSTESVSRPVHKGIVKGWKSRKDIQEPLPEKKPDSYEKDDFLESGGHRNAGLLPKQEIVVNDLACGKLATNALKLPQLSNTQSGPRCFAEGSAKASNPLNSSNKIYNGFHVNSHLPKNAFVGTSKDLKKITNKYQEFFGDLDFEKVDNEVALNEVPSVKTLMDSKLEDNESPSEDVRMTKEKSSVRKSGKPFKAEEYPRASSNEKAPSTLTGPKSDAISSVPAPELDDNWVLCDKCQKWRLLPLGRNPRRLPEKWVCSMLDWLPAMNQCTFSEEETSNAARALYQVSDPLKAAHKLPGINLSVVSSTSVSNSAHNGHMFGQQTSHSEGKKKQQPKEDSSTLVGGEPLELPKSMKKNPHKKNKNLDWVNQSSAVDEFGNKYVGQCSSPLAENHTNKPHNRSLLESCSIGGDVKKSKTRKRRQSGSDSSRSSKKVKPQNVPYNDENGMSAPAVHLTESGNFLENSSPNHMPRKDKRTIDGHSKDVKDEFPHHIAATEITYHASLPNCKRDDKSSSQEIKRQGEQVTHPYVKDLQQIGHQSRGKSEDNERKVKKARPSNSERKVATTRNSTCETGQKVIRSIDKQIKQERGCSGTADSLKTDLGTTHPSVASASTSSSSKVSGSCKIKTDGQEVKGSPVESVSSSPLRVLTIDKRSSTSRNLREKDDGDGTFVDNCSLKGSLGGASNKVHHSTSVEFPVVDLQDKDLGFVSFNKIKEENKYSCDFATKPINDASSKGTQDNFKSQASERYQDERKDNRTLNGGSHKIKLENGMSLHHGNCSFTSENDKVHVTAPDSNDEALGDIPLSNQKLTGRSKFQESSNSFDKDGNNFISEKGSGVKDVGAISDCENKSTPRYNDCQDDKLDMKESIVLDRNVQNASKKLFSDIRSDSETSVSQKSNTLPPSARSKSYKGAHLPLVSGPHKENAVDILLGDARGDTSKAPEQNKKLEKHTPSRHSNATMHKMRDQDGSSVGKDSRSQAATNAMKEAKDLKRLADRLKNSGSADSTGMYFEAALKFLYGASLLESGSRENNKHNDFQCIDMYRSTAKFCEFCAHEYERSKDMVSAALAYKCMEVSYMRVIYSSDGNSYKDRNEVQMALQIIPPGESPASSASDVDNLNNPITVEKVSTSKAMTSPQVAGNTGITSRNRSSFTRLLEIAQDANAAMEAARKSRASFTAANLRSKNAGCSDSISTVKKALDFNFQDVEGLLRLVRIAKDANSR